MAGQTGTARPTGVGAPTTYRVPFNTPGIHGSELDYIAQAIRNRHLSGDGTFTRRCSAYLEDALGAARVLLTPSCTHALELAAFLLDIGPGDEVVVPAFTFVSTPNAFVLRGARPVFADIREDTLNLDERKLSQVITDKTKAIVPVHYAGIACAMEPILHRAFATRAAVIEDNAHGLFGSFGGQALGTFGRLATLSFHETKNVICGEGGALVINDESLIERAEIVREKGTNRSQFFRGEVDRYTWVDAGSSYLPSDMLAAFLYGQLEHAHEIQAARARIWNRYMEGLADWAKTQGVALPAVPTGCEPAYHLFYLVMPSLETRTRFIDHLAAAGIQAVFHYQALHTSRMGELFGGKPGDCPVAERISDCLVRLPFFNTISDEQIELVIERVTAFEV
jgi:dTDP-4-amino-4,6-dideoxygalactose transaminase